jgi:hypothetical protein
MNYFFFLMVCTFVCRRIRSLSSILILSISLIRVADVDDSLGVICSVINFHK